MISYDEALAKLLAAADDAGRLPYATVTLEDSLGRVCAADVHAKDPLPPFDNSSMDGFALRASDWSGKPLPLLGRVVAGDPPGQAAPGGAYEITTGAPLPAGCDAVARVEDCEVSSGGKTVAFNEKPEAGDFVRKTGADFPSDGLALASGTLLEPRHALALAALGVERVPVRRRPKVALIATGRELAAPGERPAPGQIRDATGAYLTYALTRAMCDFRHFGVVKDEPADFAARLDRALEMEPDLILTTGAVSMGLHDFVPRALKDHGGEPIFHKAAIRPGKPVLAARVGGALLLGLPGNPLSTVVGLRFFAEPYLRRLLGRPDEKPRLAPLAAPADKPGGLRCFFKAALTDDFHVKVLKGQASFQIDPLLSSDCWAVLPEEGERVEAGTKVEVYPL